jgi:hypothetical protein
MPDPCSFRFADMNHSAEISTRGKVWLWGAAWTAAAVGIGILDPQYLAAPYLFPLGFLVALPPDNPPSPSIYILLLGAIYALYPILTFIGLKQHRCRRFYICFGILCVLLVLNVVGCHAEIKEGIHT